MVTILELKKSKMMALKNHDTNATNVLGIIISAYQKNQIEKQAKGQEMTDADMVSILNKTLKELTDEKKMFLDAGREEQANNDEEQIKLVKSYLPKMMDDDEIRKVIESLDDKSIKSIMVKFKTDYAGKADMASVNRIAKEFQ